MIQVNCPPEIPSNIVLIGPPGCGKGTQARRIAERLAIPHISTGDILRAAVRDQSPLGRRVADIMAAGGLVGDDVITDLVRERLAAADAAGGFILDGYPRTGSQAAALDTMREPQSFMVLLIEVPGDAIVRRMSSRRICDSCAITQSVSAESAADREGCPYCGGSLVIRPDDHPDTVRRRLETYAEACGPVVAYYRPRPLFAAVDGLRHADMVAAAIMECVERARRGPKE